MTDPDPKRLARTAALRKYDADRLEQSLAMLPKPVTRPAMVVLVGLPGSGKSYLARAISSRYPAAILDSDALRHVLFAAPQHTQSEHARLFPAMHVLIDRLLARGIPVIVDATNLKESSRKPYYDVARRYGANVILVRTRAPVATVRQRLASRESARDPLDRSTATLEVFEKMRDDVQRIRQQHISVDTSRDTGAAVDRIVALLQS